MPRSSEARDDEIARRVHWYERGLQHLIAIRPKEQQGRPLTADEQALAVEYADSVTAYERAVQGKATAPPPAPIARPAKPAEKPRRPYRRRARAKRTPKAAAPPASE